MNGQPTDDYSVLPNLLFIKGSCDNEKPIFYSVPVKTNFRIRDDNKWVEIKDFYATPPENLFKDTEMEPVSYNSEKKKRKFKTFRKTMEC